VATSRERRVHEITIRVAAPDDAARIAMVHHAAVQGERSLGDYDAEQLEAWAQSRPLTELRKRIAVRRFFVAESTTEPAGYAQLDVGNAVIRAIYVAPHYQRRGVGRRLAQAVFAAAREAGFEQLELDSSLNAVPFYETLGFARLGNVDHRLSNGVIMPCVRMTKSLGDEPRERQPRS
jgi:GNAT superfamily N-acetyltransferase